MLPDGEESSLDGQGRRASPVTIYHLGWAGFAEPEQLERQFHELILGGP